jgi:hypothetical protein
MLRFAAKKNLNEDLNKYCSFRMIKVANVVLIYI